MAKKNTGDLVSNRRARYDYEILETFEAGIVLQGTEVKSLREHHGSLQEAYVKVVRSELWLIGCSISPYKYGNIHNHEEARDRKLLMHKLEIQRLKEAVQEKGLTLVPLGLYLSKGKVKLKFGLARGKQHQDRRATIKERDEKRRMDRIRREGSDR